MATPHRMNTAAGMRTVPAFCPGWPVLATRERGVRRRGGQWISTRDVTERGLRAGDVGTIVERHVVPGVPEEGYSVEFFDMTSAARSPWSRRG